jgi:hypothetical protein
MNRSGIRKVLVAVLGSVLMWTACSTAWVSEAEQIVAALMPAVANLVTLVATLQGKNVSAADLRTIQSAGAEAGADLQVMSALIAQYEKADAAAQPGLLNQIQAAMSAVQTKLNGLMPALHITDAATRAKVGAVVGLMVSELESMAAIVPLARGGASQGMVRMAAKQAKQRAPLTANEFVGSYNSVMAAKTGDAEFDRATAGLRIHLHGKFERWASGGWLK